MQNKVKSVVFNAIGIGHDNATTRAQLRIKTGYNDRLIRQAMQNRRIKSIRDATQGAMAFVRPVNDKIIDWQMDIFDYMKESGL